tara:strand:+ start:126 stop:434 length:309 start_codon:yes stop_codon:yes gene_type:complete
MNMNEYTGTSEKTEQVKEKTVEEAIVELHMKCDDMHMVAHSLEGLEKRICGDTVDLKTGDKPLAIAEPNGLLERLEYISSILQVALHRMQVSTSAIDNRLGE